MPGLAPPRPRRTGRFRSSCGAIRAVARQAAANLVRERGGGRTWMRGARSTCGRAAQADKLRLAAGLDAGGRAAWPGVQGGLRPAHVACAGSAAGRGGRAGRPGDRSGNGR